MLVPEGRQLFGHLTVEDNLELGAYSPRARRRMKENMARAFELFPRLEQRRSQESRTLSGGEQQMLAVAAA